MGDVGSELPEPSPLEGPSPAITAHLSCSRGGYPAPSPLPTYPVRWDIKFKKSMGGWEKGTGMDRHIPAQTDPETDPHPEDMVSAHLEPWTRARPSLLLSNLRSWAIIKSLGYTSPWGYATMTVDVTSC